MVKREERITGPRLLGVWAAVIVGPWAAIVFAVGVALGWWLR